MRYVVKGLLDFRMMIPVDKEWVNIDFTGGRTAGYGDYAATYTTDDPVMMHIIENSDEFIMGKVTKG